MAASVHRLYSFFVKSLMGFVGSVRLSRIIYEHPLKIFGEQKSLVNSLHVSGKKAPAHIFYDLMMCGECPVHSYPVAVVICCYST